jgi:hypothetical protein
MTNNRISTYAGNGVSKSSGDGVWRLGVTEPPSASFSMILEISTSSSSREACAQCYRANAANPRE